MENVARIFEVSELCIIYFRPHGGGPYPRLKTAGLQMPRCDLDFSPIGIVAEAPHSEIQSVSQGGLRNNEENGLFLGDRAQVSRGHDMASSQTSRIVDLKGISLHIVEDGPADGEHVLMLHGFPDFWWAWRKQSSALAEAGFRVVMVDMRGYGQSDVPSDIADYRLSSLVGDVVELASCLGWQRFNIVGHDWGGIVAWAVASLHPMLVKRLVVLNAPHLDVMADVLRKTPSQMIRSAYIAFFQLPSLPEALLSGGRFKLLSDALTKTARPGTFTDDEIEHYRQQWRADGRVKAMLNYYRALVREARPALGRIVPPVLILWGCKDRALDFKLAKESLIQCANGRMCIHRSATHWVHLEEPEWTNGNLIRFMSEDHELDRPEPGMFEETL